MQFGLGFLLWFALDCVLVLILLSYLLLFLVFGLFYLFVTWIVFGVASCFLLCLLTDLLGLLICVCDFVLLICVVVIACWVWFCFGFTLLLCLGCFAGFVFVWIVCFLFDCCSI